MPYSFHIMRFNGREIRLEDILNKTAQARSAYEESAFSFIRGWSSDSDSFTQRTSGSTGKPKSISISRHQMVASARMTQQVLQLQAGETALLCLDAGYIAGKMMIVRAFTTDMNLIMVDPSSNPLKAIHAKERIDFIALVPAQLSEILQSDENHRLNEIKNIIVGGAELNESITNKISKFSGRVFETYGMTETISHIALRPVNGPWASEYFKTLPGITIGTDDRGCLEIHAPFLPEKVVTNDMVYLKNATSFKWIGRADNIINSGGIKINPESIEGEIQKLFVALQIQNRFIISSLPDPVLSNKLILIIEGNLPTTIERLSTSLKEILPPYHVPRQIIVNAIFATTENGKVNRQETTKNIEI
jgi:O-succinylbenzoic acid--CoA ligase